MAEGGMAAAMGNVDDRDSWKVHFADTMRGGQYVNNWRMAELHAKESPARVYELEAWGAVFDRTKDGKILQRNFGGHRYPRLAHVGDRTGLELIRTLQDHGIHQGITVHMEWTIITLLKDGERVIGAVGYDRERGRFKVFHAKAVVVASGGLGRAYKITSNSWEGTGDGHSLAYHAGAELVDMEFIQFHPTGMVWPPSVCGILVTEGVRGEGGVLRNKDGKRFMFDDIPDNYKSQTSDNPEEGWRYVTGDKSARRPPELLTRDHVARCINREVKAGRGSPHGGVYLDIAWIKEKIANAPEHIKKKLPSMYHQFIQLANLDITKEPMEVGPTTHYVMGGVRVNGDTQMSTVPGLFAAGECAAGLHGANRLGGNSLSDLLVFGKRAGEFAAQFARNIPDGKINEAEVEQSVREAREPFERGATAAGQAEGPYQIQHDLQNMMQDLVGIVRREDEMVRAEEGLKKLWERARKTAVYGNCEYNPGWHTALDLKHLLTISEAITRSALDRKESRGGHFREDFPNKDAAAAKFNVVTFKAADGSMKLRREPIPEMPENLKQIIEEMK
jgi:succinate dehydrogenase / fumarate reductase flavoprotein subunit